MKILITGGGGFIGQKLAKKLCEAGTLNQQKITGITLADVVEPASSETNIPVHRIISDISSGSDVDALFEGKPDVIYHLAAIVSGAAEADFDLGMRINLGGTMNVFSAARKLGESSGTSPMVIYASSVAVHGGEAPETVTDGIELNPQTSYGIQKSIGELLLQDYSRKGFIDGRGLRLPTVSIRPGKANAAASSFMSSIFRDTLQGDNSNCPVGRNFPVWHTAPRTIVENMIHSVSIPAADFGFNRNLNLPGRTDTIGEMIDAMTTVAGPDAESRITWETDEVIENIVMGWRSHFAPEKALSLGFKADSSFADSVQYFLEDDLV
ncbi:NAD-dependent dehydratase [Rhodobacterales bacterium 52_120_T64]|nr:NAD-dependent dehydratase [Rhodobacterales bacterium 52_120_T64]